MVFKKRDPVLGCAEKTKFPVLVSVMGKIGVGKSYYTQHIIAAMSEHGKKAAMLSSGDLVRAEIAAMSEIGRAIKDAYDAGVLCDYDLVKQLIFQELIRLRDDDHDVVFLDGAIRNIDQIEQLGDHFMGHVKGSIHLLASDDIILERIEKRSRDLIAQGGEARQDDSDMNAVRKRLDVYNNQVLPAHEVLVDMIGRNGHFTIEIPCENHRDPDEIRDLALEQIVPQLIEIIDEHNTL
ncbi:nucleoside monophosphate kinase [Candidatus Saccharibacteria bacterium]|nr:nucleoside monophosphate kinase [Candidatus Saccharibacteria bacterium]MCL1962919.1 nucleoside monophosphate kinase [Candidatus Saccharibacteria bacterium]